jgi:GT2 family glycosyltransferase
LTERNVSVVIPNWNGKELLEKNLPPLIEALQYEKGNHEIIIVDDASTDGSVEFIKDFYSQVRLIQVEKNRGFANACNIGVSKSKNDIVLLLNSDVEVKKDFLKPLLTHFDDKKVFATSPKVLTEDMLVLNWAFFGCTVILIRGRSKMFLHLCSLLRVLLPLLRRNS